MPFYFPYHYRLSVLAELVPLKSTNNRSKLLEYFHTSLSYFFLCCLPFKLFPYGYLILIIMNDEKENII